MGFTTTLLASIGLIWISRFLLSTYHFINTYFLHKSTLPLYRHRSTSGKPPWAIVTGASDGIGRGYAHELASHGFNLILHGHNSQKLQAVQYCLRETFPQIQTRVLLLDASTHSLSSLKELEEAVETLKDLHITILINNVGTGATPSGHVFGNLECERPADIDGILNTNARFPAHFTRSVIPLLLSHNKPALILTMGSISDMGSPYLSVYSGCKAFDTAFSRSLTREMRAEGREHVEVLGIMTCQVTETAMENSPSSILKPNAVDYARAALGRVGCGYDVVEGCWPHALLRAVLQRIPAGFFSGMLIDSVREEMKVEGKRA
ncbi:hypothetical protein G7Y89_g4879 [Cudoniella acicularis]|uniref:NAD(P)-binding protein n=1 Tax=Cudoniella acicularis TaxID=354080 RepID=A0A8H4RPD3_9HELO|nr:hypothetical protein G7Y89_g4879 [Cudoniella acicularis]